MSQNVPNSTELDTKQAERIRQIVELRAQGGTIAGIAKALDISEKTVDRDLAKVREENLQTLVDELIRQQLTDIIESETRTRMLFRHKLLELLMPRRIESKGQIDANIIIKSFDLGVKHAEGNNDSVQPAS